MNPGDFNKKITIQSKTVTQDAELNPVELWTDFKSVYAQLVDQTSREAYRLRTENSEISRVYRIRYISGVTGFQRIKAGAEYYQIAGKPINEGDKNVTLLIACKGAI